MFFQVKKRLFYSICTVFLCLLVLFFPLPSSADTPITVATWNTAFIDRSVFDLDLEGFVNEVDFDILLVNEIKIQDDLDQLKSAMERDDNDTAISSFGRGTNDLEVGIISRFPLTDIVEFDRSLDNSGSVEEERLERVDLPGIANVGVGRGFLVAKVPDLKLFVIVTHLKSSRGQSGASDRENTQKRELVAAAAAQHIVQLREDNPDYSVLFGGDLNVGVSDEDKNGNNLEDDRTDGYDDTHAILSEGIIDGLRMRSLARNLGSTFVGRDGIPDFPRAGAIDVLYIDGPLADQFNNAQSTSSSFGSDHLAVFATTGDLAINDTGSPEIDSITITNALPNPSGRDAENETITLTYTGSDTANISGWSLRDRAGRIYTFPLDTQLNPGDNEIRLIVNSMPLNNSGDTITLFDFAGIQFGDTFEYSGSRTFAKVFNDIIKG